jgi:nickel/cobalt transporter (NicO) family protein
MKAAFLLILTLVAILSSEVAGAQNPFTSPSESRPNRPEPAIRSEFFPSIVLWQHKLRQEMSRLIRMPKEEGKYMPLIFLMGLAFAYGAIHAAGPGHGKFVAVSYVLSHRSSISNGLLFGVFIALFHGFSGAIGVLGLRYLIQRSFGETMATATEVTQFVSFGLIILLGLGILLKHAASLFHAKEKSLTQPSRRGLLPWALAIGLIPCPAVVMVMLFCLSMEAMLLGMLMAISISLGMAGTIALVIVAVVMGKGLTLNLLPEKHVDRIEGIVGILSGAVVAVFGALFLFASFHSAS